MNRFLIVYTLLMALMFVLLSACATQPAPVTPSTTPAIAPAQPTPVANTPTAEDSAWQGVIAEAKKEGKLTLYSFSLTGDIGVAVAKAFKNRYGIDVGIVTGPGSQMMERIRSEQRAGQHAVDVFDSSTGLVIQAKQDGLSLRIPEMPVLKEKTVWLVEPGSVDIDGYMVILYATPLLAFYNTNLVKAEELPKSWLQLLEPKWKGKIAVSTPDTVPTPNRFFVIMVDRKALDISFFQGLTKQELKIYPGVRDSLAAVARGEAQIELNNSTVIAGSLIKEGAPLRAFDMEEGTVGGGAAMAIIKNLPHPNAASLYINWILSAEGQSTFHKAAAGLSLRKDVPDYRPPATQVIPKKLFLETEKDIVEVARVQRERVLSKIWGLK